MQPAAIRANEPDRRSTTARDHERNPVAGRRPHRHSDTYRRIMLERELADGRTVHRRDPQIAVTTIVRKVGDFCSIRTDRRRLCLAGLAGDTRAPSRVVSWRTTDRELPDIRLSSDAARQQAARLMDVRFDERLIPVSELPVISTVLSDCSQIEYRRIEQRAASRGA